MHQSSFLIVSLTKNAKLLLKNYDLPAGQWKQYLKKKEKVALEVVFQKQIIGTS